MSSEAPLFSFGIVADPQYADADDAWDFHRTAKRYYRGSLPILADACRDWSQQEPRPQFVTQLGDLWDGLIKPNRDAAVKTLKDVINTCDVKEWHHLVGNHELYVYSRDELGSVLNMRTPRHFYSFQPHASFRFCVLDTFDVSIINQGEENTPKHQEAMDMLRKNNPNDVTAPCDWIAGLHGIAKRFVPYNGGIGEEQLAWLRNELAASQAANQRVVLLSHVALQRGGAADETLVWNHEEVMQTINAFPGVVVACLHGHDHHGGYVHDSHGIHHVTFESPMLCKPGEKAWATARVYPDRIDIAGVGNVPSRVLSFGSGRGSSASDGASH